MKLLVNAFLILGVTFAATAAKADEALMTIRFNQANVAYQDKLFYAVREAVKAKPTVVFSIVDVTPGGAQGKGKQVAADIARIGVNPSQIEFRPQAGNVTAEEVQIFVR